MLPFRRLSRWLAIFALVTTWLSLVAANPPAHSLEKVAMYFVYRNAVTAYGEKQQEIFSGLSKTTGSHPDKGANFLEFLNHLHPVNTQSPFPWVDWDLTSRGVDLNNPDVEKATKMLLATGGGGQFQTHLIRPASQGRKYWDQVASVRKVMLDCMYFPFPLA